MKDILNKMAKSTIILIIGIIIGCSLGVYAAIKYSATDIGYKNKTVKEALDELYKGKFNILCKRATELHTKECKSENGQGCNALGYTEGNKGITIKYGNLGTKGTLASGDAFDCDVNGDGTYDKNTERFYYVSKYYNTETKQFESDTAVLIYYSNVSNGQITNNANYAYHSGSNVNYNGPVTAKLQLPEKGDWPNISLKNKTRAILNEQGTSTRTGGLLPSEYSYLGYSARLLTYQEVVNACGSGDTITTGYLKDCQYLMENTQFDDSSLLWSYWAETALSSTNNSIYVITADIRLSYTGSTSSVGVRPAIEVPISDIEY